MIRIITILLFKRKKEFLIVFLLFITHIDSLSQYSKKTVIKRVQLTEYVFCDSRIESIIDSLVFWPKSSEPTNRYYRLGNTFDYVYALSEIKDHQNPVPARKLYYEGRLCDGYPFFESANHIWLTKEVPVKYLKKE